MLSCHDVTSLASDYLDSVLPRRARLGIRVHLLLCWMCRRYVRQIELTTKVLRGLARAEDAVEPPDSVRDVFRAWKAERDDSDPKTR
jgi:predicted anti-sigma-YlaC factor YlaD